ncbi:MULTISPECIES: InlB B-repeat-containing protein [unclassified Enterococcus]|uniref:InlB B-repeat-containing protein n=1 Tax=unclassified Enterococcus TaxID=2608891 RepID=UPI0015522F77|nr:MULTISPECIES: InlB B-repeat-containing protein [unclassified Enterococcus]MBS7577742.1 InlB B-repeat-containing protein [Enterococcus sp. MMGLQ5-2]MBS7584064.1 InlB B-repeat-containing protein [Enterococcus sp. MMGLQ5-1]NPD11925.1 leucine-rich repeat protein [Enterococcus sp. MMGLQ5-1]NPD37572.1 leucine-rich repeat protein [Enterococcus sp. MMGLQ5-2]
MQLSKSRLLGVVLVTFILFTSFFALGEIKAFAAAVGDTFTVQGDSQELVYEITSADTVDVIKSNKPDLSGVFTLGATVENEGVTYKITKIGYGAFKATHLTKIDLSKASNLTRIGEYSFGTVTGATEAMGYDTVILPEGVTYIANGAFSGNAVGSSLTTINIPSTVETVGAYAFALNPSLKTLDFRNCDNLKIMGPCIFWETPLDTLYLPANLEAIECGSSNNTWFTSFPEGKTPAESYHTNIYSTLQYSDSYSLPLWAKNMILNANINVTIHSLPSLMFLERPTQPNISFARPLGKFSWQQQSLRIYNKQYKHEYIMSGNIWYETNYSIYLDDVKVKDTQENTWGGSAAPIVTFENLDEGIHTVKIVNAVGMKVVETFKVDFSSIEFDSDGGSAVGSIVFKPLTYDEYKDGCSNKLDKSQKPTDPTKKGYTFKGWYKDSDANEYDFEAYRLSDGDITLKAKWDANTYKVTFVDWENKEIASSTVEYEKSATAPAPPARDGYTFKGWDKDFSKVTEDMTITALYEKNKSESGNVEPSDPSNNQPSNPGNVEPSNPINDKPNNPSNKPSGSENNSVNDGNKPSVVESSDGNRNSSEAGKSKVSVAKDKSTSSTTTSKSNVGSTKVKKTFVTTTENNSPTESTTAAKTGDATLLVPLAVVCLLSLGMMVAVMIKKKRVK